MIEVTQFNVGGFDKNLSYVLSDDESGEAFIVDPAGDIDELVHFVTNTALHVQGVLLTHTHADHYDALDDVLTRFAQPVYVHQRGLEHIATYAAATNVIPEHITLGSYAVTVLYTPGHSIDSICLYVPAEASKAGAPLLLSGDTLFVGGCGRTNEAGVESLYESLRLLQTLPPATVVYPGHDYGSTSASTLREESEHNRFLTAADFSQFKQLRLG